MDAVSVTDIGSNLSLTPEAENSDWYQGASNVSLNPSQGADAESNSDMNKQGFEQSGELSNETGENIYQFLEKTAKAISAHLFQGFGEMFQQSENHEVFIIDKLSQLEQKAKEYQKELNQGKQELAQKLKVLSSTLRLGDVENDSISECQDT